MRISCIQSYGIIANQQNQIKKDSVKNSVTNPIAVNKSFSSLPIGYVPYQINFGGEGKIYQTLPEILQLKKLKNLPCIYCGKKMIPSRVYGELQFSNNKVARTLKEFVEMIKPSILSLDENGKKIFKKAEVLAQKTPNETVSKMLDDVSSNLEIPKFIKNSAYRNLTTTEYTQRIIEILSPYEDALMPIEKAIFQEIKIANQGDAKKSLQDIMNDLRGLTIGTLSEKHRKIITSIEKIASDNLSKITKHKVFEITKRAEKLLEAEDATKPYKRKDFIRDLSRIKSDNQEKNILQKIVKIAQTTPNSENDIGAFIVKYSNKDVKGANVLAKQRTNEEIAQRLINPSIASVEHIRTQESYKLQNLGNSNFNEISKDSIGNLALAHRSCNSERDNITLSQYINSKPEVKKYIQNHVDYVSDAINNGELTDMKNYPKQLKVAYEEGSKGSIKINLPE